MDLFGKCALLISHPGHEIRIHGWLERAKPVVYVLTDGSGRLGEARVASTTRILNNAGAKPGSIYGRFRDRDLYQAVLRQDLDLFCAVAVELADAIVKEEFDFILGDAAEGEILTHDLWRGMIDAAVTDAQRRLDRKIASYQFLLEGPPENCPNASLTGALRLLLDEPELARKLAAARSYPELRAEINRTLEAYGEEAFRLELLQRADRQPAGCVPGIPRYEGHGEKLVAAGVYREPIRYQQHVTPILTELARRRRVA